MLETFVRMYGMFRYIMRMNENGYHPRMEEIQRHCTYFEEGREELIHPNTIGDYFRRAHRFLGMKIEHDSSYGYYIRDYKDWYQDHDFLVGCFAEHLALNGGFKRIKNYTEAQKYMAYVFTTKGKDGKLDKNFPGVFIQSQMKEEEEAAHRTWIEKEKQRFPFEDYAHGEVKIPGISAIPEGEYTVVITWSPKFREWLPQIIGDQAFNRQWQGVRIHAGNTAADTRGCILPGENKIPGRVINSRRCLRMIVTRLTEAYARGESVRLKILPGPP